MATQNIDLRGSQGAVIAPSGPVTQTFIGYTAEQVSVLIAQIRRAEQPKLYDGRQPYRGLAPFGEEDAEFFFGREKLVAELLAQVAGGALRLHRRAFRQRQVVAGPGRPDPCAQAGQAAGQRQVALHQPLPARRPRRAVGPGHGPYGEGPRPRPITCASHGTTDPAALHEQAEALLTHQPEQRAVVYVDQFEELFTQTKAEEARRAFLDLLTTAAEREDGRVIVLISMRSDFLSQCATYPALRGLISRQFQLVGAMAPDELARAIALPALEVGAEIEPELVAQVIADMRGEPGALPLMQFALKDLFDSLHPVARPARQADQSGLPGARRHRRGAGAARRCGVSEA